MIRKLKMQSLLYMKLKSYLLILSKKAHSTTHNIIFLRSSTPTLLLSFDLNCYVNSRE
jgi:hypothetical protein